MVKFGHPYHLAFFTIVVLGQEATLLWKNIYVVVDRRQVFVFEDFFDFGRRTTAFLQPLANSFGTLCVVKEDGEIEHLPPSRRPLDRPTGTRDQQLTNDDSYHSPHGAAPEVSAI